MDSFRNISLRYKITIIIVFTVLIILTIGFSVDLYSETRSIKKRILSEKILITKIVGNYVIADLTFNNKEAAKNSLSYLKRDESVINAHLYNAKNEYFVSLFEEKDNYLVDGNQHHLSYKFQENHLYISEPIMLDGEIIGTLYLHASTTDYLESVKSRLIYLAALLIVLVLVTIVVAGKLSKIVTSPILSLANAAINFTRDSNYKLNLKSPYKDETGQLINAFNNMFLKIETREKERDLAINRLENNEKNLSLILNNMVDGIITTDESGIILSANTSAETMFGYSVNEITGTSIEKLSSDSSSGDFIKTYLKDRQTKYIGMGREIEMLRKDNTTFFIRLSVSELPNDADNKQRFICSCQDLTQLKLQEEQLRRTQKMDALGKLTGGIAHDYNNMLGVISGYAELLETKLNTQPKLAHYAHSIQQAGLRGAKLTKKLLAFSKQNTLGAKTLNINKLLLNEQDMLQKTLTVRIKLVLDLDKQLWSVWLDESDMTDIILNMSINAMHAITDIGQLTLRTHNQTLSTADAKVLSLKAGDYVTFSISDTGCGMDNATKEKIFDPFFTTKGKMGTGLGLSQVYGFVKNSGGIINVYSEPGIGTQFNLYFPRHFTDENDTNPIKPQTETKILGTEKILIVDDEPALLALTKEILSEHGYDVYTAKNGKQALELLQTQPVNLLFTDVIMPDMNGYELASIVQSKYPEILIQLASGFSDERHIDKQNPSLQKNLLAKPYKSAELLKCIRKLLD